MIDETHLGKIISNKTSGDGHKTKKSKDSKDVINIPKEEWVVVENCHIAVKTEEEHNKVLLFFNRLTKTPKRKGSNIYPLSGLLKCSRCVHTMVVGFRSDRKDVEYIKPCWYLDDVGNKCTNRGSESSIVHIEIMKQLRMYEEELREALFDEAGENDVVLRDINIVLNEISKLEKKLTKIDELVGEEYYTLSEAKKRKADVKTNLDEAETKLKLFKLKLDNNQKMTNQERLNIIDEFKEAMGNGNHTAEEVNELYKSIISHIVWDRKDDEYLIEIIFL